MVFGGLVKIQAEFDEVCADGRMMPGEAVRVFGGGRRRTQGLALLAAAGFDRPRDRGEAAMNPFPEKSPTC